MPQINLLPWRSELRQRRQKEFLTLLGIIILVMGAVVYGVRLQFESMISFQEQRNAFMEAEIKKLDTKIAEIKTLEEERNRLLARREIIEQLQASRPEIVHLFDELVTTLPEGVYFQKIQQIERAVTIQGQAQSNARVSSLMRNLDASDWIANPALVEIVGVPGPAGMQIRLSNFSVRVAQRDKNNAEEDEGAGQ